MPEPLAAAGEAIGWVGAPLADLEGETVGEVQSVYIDSTVARARLAGRETDRRPARRGARIVAVPLDVCAGAAGVGVWAAVDGDAACAARRSSTRPGRCCASTS